MNSTDKRVAVIGAGITGLTAAWHLHRAGFHVDVYERGAQAGGSICTVKDNGYVCESGPNTLQEGFPELDTLIREVGLEEEKILSNPDASKRFVVRNGRPCALPSGPLGLIGCKLVSWRAKWRLIREPRAPGPPADTEESLADFAIRRLGREWLDYGMSPFVGGIYAGKPERLSYRLALPRLYKLEKEHGSLIKGMVASARERKAKGLPRGGRLFSFRNGLQVLTQRIEERLKKQIYLETEVLSLKRDDRWILDASRYNRVIRGNYAAVLMALPAHRATRIEWKDMPASDTVLETLRTIEYAPVSTVTMAFPRDAVQHALDGFGMLVPEVENGEILGTIFASSLFPGRVPDGQVLLTTFVGGARQPDLAALPWPETEALVKRALSSYVGVSGDPTWIDRRRWRHAIPQYTLGYGDILKALDSIEENNSGLFFAGNYRHGISVGDCVASGKNTALRIESFLAS